MSLNEGLVVEKKMSWIKSALLVSLGMKTRAVFLCVQGSILF